MKRAARTSGALAAWRRPAPREFRAVHGALRRHYGPRPWRVEREPVLDSLVATILSQATSDANSGRAFDSLKAAFADWDAVRKAPARKIEAAIRSGGLARNKSRTIKRVLETIHAARGETSLEHLRRAPTERIKAELGALPGVGPKTVACVLMFNLKRPDFPVDTHIHRIARRLGWAPPKANAEATYRHLNVRVPDPLTYEMHVLLITHGRRICKAQRPACPYCPVQDACDEGRRRLGLKWSVRRP